MCCAGNSGVQFHQVSPCGVYRPAIPCVGGPDWLDDAAVDQSANSHRRTACCIPFERQHDSRGLCLLHFYH